MACRNVCKLCPRLVISQNVTFASGVLTVNLPAGSYNRGEKYCIVIAQAIPDAATINAPVVITIGTGTVQYPLTRRNCAQVTACCALASSIMKMDSRKLSGSYICMGASPRKGALYG